MSRVVEIKHPLVSHHLTRLRDKHTPPCLFREQVRRLSFLLAYEATATLPLETHSIETPLTSINAQQIACRIGIVPILRAGLGMLDPIQELIPEAEVWHIGFYRDETTHQPVEYYQKFSNIPPDVAFIVDPMLATGGSANAAINQAKQWGIPTLSLLCLIAAPEGIKAVKTSHPDVNIFTCSIDDHLNENAYIVPGLGDAGDRIFNTL